MSKRKYFLISIVLFLGIFFLYKLVFNHVYIKNGVKFYEGTEQITFVSNLADTFIINLTGYDTLFIKKGNKYYEQSRLKYNHGLNDSMRSDFLCMNTAGKKTSYFGISLDGVKGYLFRSAIPVDSISTANYQRLRIGDIEFNDVIKLNFDMRNEPNNPRKRISYMYFSVKNGILQFVNENNEVYSIRSIRLNNMEQLF